MSENTEKQMKVDNSSPVMDDNHNKSKDYQILIGDNSCDQSTQHHLSQSENWFRSYMGSYESAIDYHKSFRNYISSPHIFLLVLFVAIYLLLILLGASVFAIFEQKAEFQLRDNILRIQHNFLTKNPCVDAEELDTFIREVLKSADSGVNLHLMNKIIKQKQNGPLNQFPTNSETSTAKSTQSTRPPTRPSTTTPPPPQPSSTSSPTTQKMWKLLSKVKTFVGKGNSNAKVELEEEESEEPELMVPTELSNWEFTSSLMFVTSVVTTIGYGHVTPNTVEGKVFCLVFSCVSIPFTLVFLSIIVSLLKNGPVKKLEKWLIRTILKHFHSFPEFFIRILHVIIVTFILLLLILILPAIAFSYIENEWTFLDSVYYCYISLTTVGLGDFVAATNHMLYSHYLQFYRICIILYLYGGLALIMLWIAVILRIPYLNLKPFLLTETEELDEQTNIIDYNKESPKTTYGTQFFAQK